MSMTSSAPARNGLRIAVALLAGFATVAVLSMATDAVLHAAGFFPNDGSVGGDAELALALGYRTAYTVLGGYVTAWLAPDRKLRIAAILGALGTVVAAAGAVAMWQVGHNWYPVALAALALPSTALGGWLYTRTSR